jgi:hypothetical protein
VTETSSEASTERAPQQQAPAGGSRAYTRFIILAPARSGSNLLASQLNAHPDMVCFAELFNYTVDFIIYDVDGYDGHSPEDIALRERDRPAFLRTRIFGQHDEGIHAVGFKLPYEHIWLVPDVLEWLLAQDDLRVIHLRRRNLLRARVSLRIAEMTKVWMERKPPPLTSLLTPANAFRALRHPGRATNAVRATLWPKLPGPQAQREPITISVDECKFYFAWVEENAAQYGSAFGDHPVLTIYYEDLVANREAVLHELQMFLGLKPRPLRVATRQQNPEPLEELIANYDELREAFRDTEYGVFFD